MHIYAPLNRSPAVKVSSFPHSYNITLYSCLLGSLVCGFVVEGLHVDKASKPHIPHQAYVSASTKDLAYFVSGTTANGMVFASGDQNRLAS